MVCGRLFMVTDDDQTKLQFAPFDDAAWLRFEKPIVSLVAQTYSPALLITDSVGDVFQLSGLEGTPEKTFRLELIRRAVSGQSRGVGLYEAKAGPYDTEFWGAPAVKENWPCRKLPRAQWCDSKGPGGFMGHTCRRGDQRPPLGTPRAYFDED